MFEFAEHRFISCVFNLPLVPIWVQTFEAVIVRQRRFLAAPTHIHKSSHRRFQSACNTWPVEQINIVWWCRDGSLFALTLAPTPIKAFVACCSRCGQNFTELLCVLHNARMLICGLVFSMSVRTFVECWLIKGSRVPLRSLYVRPSIWGFFRKRFSSWKCIFSLLFSRTKHSII